MSGLLPCVEVGPQKEASASVVWLHGLGANGHDFEPLVPHLGLPRVRFVFPHAPMRPVTINGGFTMPAWYDILRLDHSGAREKEADIRESATALRALIDREVERGTAPDRIVVVGFSQGAAMALHVGHRYPQRLAGMIALSGYPLLREQYETELAPANRDTPVLFCHGTADTVVPHAFGRHGYEDLRGHASATGLERDLQWYDYPIGHEVCGEEIAQVAQWLHAKLGD